MIRFTEDLYASESLKGRVAELKRELGEGQRIRGIWVVCRNEETGKEEAVKSELFSQEYYRQKDTEATALIDDREEMMLYLAASAVRE